MYLNYTIILWCIVLLSCFFLLAVSTWLYFRRTKHPINKSFIIFHLTRCICGCIMLISLCSLHTSIDGFFFNAIIKTIVVFTLPMIHLMDVFDLLQIIIRSKYIYTKKKISKMFSKYLSEGKIKEISAAIMRPESRRNESIYNINNIVFDREIDTNDHKTNSNKVHSSDCKVQAEYTNKSKINSLMKIKTNYINYSNRVRNKKKKVKNSTKRIKSPVIQSPRINHMADKDLVFRLTKKLMTEKYIFFQVFFFQVSIFLLWTFGFGLISVSGSNIKMVFNETLDTTSSLVLGLHLYETIFLSAISLIFVTVKIVLLVMLIRTNYSNFKKFKMIVSCLEWGHVCLATLILDILAYKNIILRLKTSWTLIIVVSITFVEICFVASNFVISSYMIKQKNDEDISLTYKLIDEDISFKELFKFAVTEHNIEQISFIRHARKIKKRSGTYRKKCTKTLYETFLKKGISPLELNMTKEYIPYIKDIEKYIRGEIDFPISSIDHLILMSVHDSGDLLSRFRLKSQFKDIMELHSIKIKTN